MSVTLHTRAEGEPADWMDASGENLDPVEVRSTVREVAAQLGTWVKQQRAVTNRGSLFDRSTYAAPDNPYDQMRIARVAVANDDVVAGAAEVTEGLAFQGVKWESAEADEADVFNQISTQLNLDLYLRAAYREMFTCSQVVTATWWGWKTFKVRGRSVAIPPLDKQVDPATGVDLFLEPRDPVTNRPLKPTRGVRRRKEYRIWCPVAMSILDNLRVVPVGSRLFGEDRLAWQATEEEISLWDGDGIMLAADPIMATLFLGRYTPGKAEAGYLAGLGVDPKRLLELNPDYVWRHTLTRPAYQDFADVRLKSVFKLLDLKQQLMEADRVQLIGAANYILLVKKGTKEDPAYPEEITNLRDNFDIIAKLPVIISDHRLEIEIITPALDLTLQGEKYDTLDRRILSRLMGALTVASNGQRNESSLTVARGVARVLESRRHMMKRTLEHRLATAVVEHPYNLKAGGLGFQETPNLAFTPRNVQLDNDAQMIQAILSTRNSKDLSRESWLEFIGFDQEVEAQRREMEAEAFDPIFQTAVPFDSPANASPQATGATGGRPPGGGTSPQSPQGKVKPKTAAGNPSTTTAGK